MLIRNAVLQRIAAGEVDTLFRRQIRVTVRSGGTLRTAIGMLDILEVAPIALTEITLDDAHRAGFGTVEEVITMLEQKADGTDYRVRVRPGGPDPRVTLRNDDELSPDDFGDVATRLERLDTRSSHGPWTRTTLGLIAERPHVRAPDLAASVGLDTATFKDNVRKLKSLGLTVSQSPGYELSPRGRVVLQHLDASD